MAITESLRADFVALQVIRELFAKTKVKWYNRTADGAPIDCKRNDLGVAFICNHEQAW